MPEEEQNKQNLSEISSIRTFRDDVEKIIEKQNKSLIGATAEELSKKRDYLIKKSTSKNWKMISAYSVIIILAASAISFAGFKSYKYFLNRGQTEPGIPKFAELFLTADKIETQKILPFDGQLEKRESLKSMKNALNYPYPKNTITYLPISIKISGSVKNIDGKSFLEILGVSPPFNVLNSLTDRFNLLAYSDSSSFNSPVFIFGVKSYEAALSGMLEWEKNMPYEIKQSLPDYSTDLKTANGFASFKDKVVKNQDTRVIENENGNPSLLYGFFNDRILIITFSQQAMEAVLNRLLF